MTVDAGGPATYLTISAPAGFERFVRAVGEPARSLTLPPSAAPNREKLQAAAAEFGIEFVGPPGA